MAYGVKRTRASLFENEEERQLARKHRIEFDTKRFNDFIDAGNIRLHVYNIAKAEKEQLDKQIHDIDE